MPSSTSSQESRVSAGGRTLLQRRTCFNPRDNITNGMKLPRLRPTFDVPKDVEEECEGALAAIALCCEGLKEGHCEAYRSVHAHAAATEDDDDFQVLGFTPSRTMLQSEMNVQLPLTDRRGVAVGYAADLSKRARVVFRKNKDDIDELWVYTTPAQGLIRCEVEVDKEKAAIQKAAREKCLDAQIRYLENQVHIYIADAITLKRAFDARLAHTARNTYPRARDRQIRKCFMSFQAVVAENAATAWLYYENRLEDKKAELKHLMHEPQPSAAAGEQMGSNYNWKAEMATAMVQEIVNGRKYLSSWWTSV